MFILKKIFIGWLMLWIFGIFFGTNAYATYDLEKWCNDGSLGIDLTSFNETSAGILKATNKMSYFLQMKCHVLLAAPPNHYIMISVREIGFRSNLYHIGNCKDYLQIENETICETVNREDEGRHYTSMDNTMRITYYTSPKGLDNKTMSGYPGFTLTFTAFQKASDRGDPCAERANSSESFLCGNNYCIWSDLICDDHNNCGDLSDEDPFGRSNCGRKGSSSLIVLGVLILLVLILMCVTTLLCSRNETIRRFSTRLRSRTTSFVPTRRSRSIHV